jgi:hypothetical protein
MRRRRLFLGQFLGLMLLGACAGEPGAAIGELPGSGRASLEKASVVSSTPISPTEDVGGSPPTAVADLETSFAQLMQARIECGRDPYACDVSTFTAENSPIYEDLTQLIATRRDARITATGGGSIRYRIDEAQNLSDSSAVVNTCITDDVVLVDGDIIFDDSMMSSLVTFKMTKVDGRWLWSEGTLTRWTTEEDLCDFDA